MKWGSTFSVIERIEPAHMIQLFQECRDISNEDLRILIQPMCMPRVLPPVTTRTALKLVPIGIRSRLELGQNDEVLL